MGNAYLGLVTSQKWWKQNLLPFGTADPWYLAPVDPCVPGLYNPLHPRRCKVKFIKTKQKGPIEYLKTWFS